MKDMPYAPRNCSIRGLQQIIPVTLCAACLACPAFGDNAPAQTNAPASAPTQTNAVASAQSAARKPERVVIKEKMFLTQINDIFLNPEDYQGKTIKYEGIFTQYRSPMTKRQCQLVYRKSPGCCGADGEAGFEIRWPKNAEKPFPKEKAWCEVVGTLTLDKESGFAYPYIVLDSLTVLEKRGAEFVRF